MDSGFKLFFSASTKGFLELGGFFFFLKVESFALNRACQFYK